MTIRRAGERDLARITELLYQVQKVHSDGRPDLFVAGAKKYDEEALRQILRDDQRPVFVAVDEADWVMGYAFCIYEQTLPGGSLKPIKSLYIDDLCVDEALRGRGIGRALYDHVVSAAQKSGCYHITLNVWNLNEKARRFYERCGLKPLKTVMEQVL